MINNIWAKFIDEELVCACPHSGKKCSDEKECKEYVGKFTTIDRDNYNKNFHSRKKQEFIKRQKNYVLS